MKRILCAAGFVVVAFSMLAGCGKKTALNDCAVMAEEKFGGVYVDLTIDEFNAMGFEYGDSVDVAFSNGYALSDIPYYNGYYAKVGCPLIVAYPGYPYIDICVNSGAPLWETANLSDGDTVTITLRKKGEFLKTQEARDIHYSDERSDYASDPVFANFRGVEVGNVNSGTLYRSASPCDNEHNRAHFSDALAREAGIAYVLDLADNETDVNGYMQADDYDSPHYRSLYDAGCVVLMDMNAEYGADEFKAALAEGFRGMIGHEGPYLVHCLEGKDRTGFVCALLGALAGADYEELEYDYMITYENYYGITKETQAGKYELIVNDVFHPLLAVMGEEAADSQTFDPQAADLRAAAESYLRSAGLSDEEIAAVRDRLER